MQFIDKIRSTTNLHRVAGLIFLRLQNEILLAEHGELHEKDVIVGWPWSVRARLTRLNGAITILVEPGKLGLDVQQVAAELASIMMNAHRLSECEVTTVTLDADYGDACWRDTLPDRLQAIRFAA